MHALASGRVPGPMSGRDGSVTMVGLVQDVSLVPLWGQTIL